MSSKFARRKNPTDLSRWSVRDVINARLDELGKSQYWLARRAGLSSEAVVYRFLAGEAETNSANVRAMLNAVGLRLEVVDGFDPESVPTRKERKSA